MCFVASAPFKFPALKHSCSGRPFIHEKIMEAIRSEPEIRTELVEKYKQLIKSGEYRMEPEELASRMVEDSFSESILRSKT